MSAYDLSIHPLLHLTLKKEYVLPERNPMNLPTVIEQFPTLSCILDGVERFVQRSIDPDVRDAQYSGKKNDTRLKIS